MHAPERRGHAHTPDVDEPLTYAVMAADTVAYLEAEVDGPAHLVGWSDGAVVALPVALRRPDLVGRMVLIGQYDNSSGRVRGSEIDRLLRGEEAKGFLRQGYDPVSPDGPGHFDVVHAKTTVPGPGHHGHLAAPSPSRRQRATCDPEAAARMVLCFRETTIRGPSRQYAHSRTVSLKIKIPWRLARAVGQQARGPVSL